MLNTPYAEFIWTIKPIVLTDAFIIHHAYVLHRHAVIIRIEYFNECFN